MDNAEPRCIAFGGLRVDDVIENALLTVVGPGAIAAATTAEKEAGQRRDQVRGALNRDLEAARYAADRAFRQYDAADPANRLVTGELEARWNLRRKYMAAAPRAGAHTKNVALHLRQKATPDQAKSMPCAASTRANCRKSA